MNMDRDIFNLNASTEATSLYILICALMDLGQSPTLPQVRAKWTGDEESLQKAVRELTHRGVLDAASPPGEDEPFSVRSREEWA